jgi:hypothetical protein
VTTTSQQQQTNQGVRPQPIEGLPGASVNTPFYSQQTTNSTSTRPNVLTPYQAIALKQTNDFNQQKLYLEQLIAKARIAAEDQTTRTERDRALQQQRESEDRLNSLFHEYTAPYMQQASNMASMNELATQPQTPSRDLAFIQHFAQGQVQGVAVGNAPGALAVRDALTGFPSLQQMWDNITVGKAHLDPAMMQEMMATQKATFAGQTAIYNSVRKSMQSIGTRQGLSPLNIAPDLVPTETKLKAAATPTPNNVPKGVPVGSQKVGTNPQTGEDVYVDPTGKRWIGKN